eukprot:7387670-Prymnesium_polylepis.2
MHCEWSTSVVPEPLVRSSTSRKTCMLGQISRQRCLMSLHTSCPSGHASGKYGARGHNEQARGTGANRLEYLAVDSRDRNKW